MFDWLIAIPPILVVLLVAGIVTLESLGLPLPGESVLIAAVLLSLGGAGVDPWLLAAAAAVGAIVGDSLGYYIGKRWGARLLRYLSQRYPKYFGVARINAAVGLMQKWGAYAVFFGRFVALLRVFAGPLAGAMAMPYGRFLLANALGGIAWAGGVTAITVALGKSALAIIHAFGWVALAAVAVLIIVIVAIVVYRARRRPEGADAATETEQELDLLIPAAQDAQGANPGGAAVRDALGAAVKPLVTFARRAPFTTILVLVIIIGGVATGAMWHLSRAQSWYGDVAFGLPPLAAGMWWTPITGSLLGNGAWHYALLIVQLLIVGGIFEFRFGWKRTALVFLGGQALAVLGTLAIVAVLAPTGWEWATRLADDLDVGASGGIAALTAALVWVLRPPWRLRLGLALGALVSLRLLYVGDLADIEHFLPVAAIFTIYAVQRHRATGLATSTREDRLIAFTALIGLGTAQVVAALFSLDGPLGKSTAETETWVGVAIDVVVILLVANGIRRGQRFAWIVAVALGIFNLLELLLIVVAVATSGSLDEGLTMNFAGSLLWVLVVGFLIVARRSFAVRVRPSKNSISGERRGTVEEAREILPKVGGSTISWMTLWPRNHYLLSPKKDGYVAYQEYSGVALALGDPVAPASELSELIHDFASRAELAGHTPAFFSATQATVDAAPASWQRVQVAEDTIIDLPGLELKGKPWQPVRSAVNRAEREGIRFKMTTLAEEPWAVLAQVRAISEDWVGDKGLPEMGFTLGGVDEALDPAVRLGIAIDDDGSVHGVTSWLPVYGKDGEVRGWTLDLMRRRDGGFKPVMEFLIISSAMAFRDEGAAFASLSGAPLAGSGEAEATPLDQVLSQVSELLEPLYGFSSLHNFKMKFNPRFEPMYLVFRDESDLPRIGIGLTRAYLPTATTGQLIRAGLGAGK